LGNQLVVAKELVKGI